MSMIGTFSRSINVSALKCVIAISLLVLVNLESTARAQSQPSTVVSTSDEKRSIKCVGGIFPERQYKPYTVCIFGTITVEIANLIDQYPNKISRLVINSEGGDARSAMKIGRRISSDRSVVEVKGKCISSCANYIVPAAKYIDLNEESVIAMHGAIPRGVMEYVSRAGHERGRTAHNVNEAIKEFANIRNGILSEENGYFDEIGMDDAYITRYREQVRNEIIKIGLFCSKFNEFMLILDDVYLSAFGIKVGMWKMTDSAEVLKYAERTFPHSSIIVGFSGNNTRITQRVGSNCRNVKDSAREENPDIF